MKFTVTGFEATLSMRFNFTYHFLAGAASLTKLASEIDQKGSEASEDERVQHLGYVSGAIIQSVAALESEIWSLYNHGIGHHLGITANNRLPSEALKTIAEEVEKFSLIPKFALALQISRNKKLDLGTQPVQDTALLIALRNEIVHYKSLGTEAIEKNKLFNRLKEIDSTTPSFFKDKGGNFFPLLCLTHKRSKWALETAISFIEHFYQNLEIPSPLQNSNKALITA